MAELLQGDDRVKRVSVSKLEKHDEPALESPIPTSDQEANVARRGSRIRAGLALAALLGEEARAASARDGDNPLAPKAPHFAPKAKRVIYLFMHGGPSQMDTFDYKPLLHRDHGKPLPFKRPKVVSAETFNLLKSPWDFKQYGQSGAWVSELFRRSERSSTICASSSRCTVPIRGMAARS